MKLLFCNKCQDVVRLFEEERTCKCGNAKGKYTDDLNAVYTGEDVFPIGFNNYDFIVALHNQPQIGFGEEFKAFVIPKQCKTFKKQ